MYKMKNFLSALYYVIYESALQILNLIPILIVYFFRVLIRQIAERIYLTFRFRQRLPPALFVIATVTPVIVLYRQANKKNKNGKSYSFFG